MSNIVEIKSEGKKIDAQEMEKPQFYFSNALAKSTKDSIVEIMIQEFNGNAINAGGYRVTNADGSNDFVMVNRLQPKKIYCFRNIANGLEKKISIHHGDSHARITYYGKINSLAEIATAQNNKFFKSGDGLTQDLNFAGKADHTYRFATYNATIYINGKKYEDGADLAAANLKGAYVQFEKGKKGHAVLCQRSESGFLGMRNDNRFYIQKSLNFTPQNN